MKLAFSSNAFKKYDIFSAINMIAEIGYSGIEILADVPHAYPKSMSVGDLNLILSLIGEKRLEISNINAFTLYAIGDVYHPSWVDGEEERIQRINHTIDCIKLAKTLKAKNISVEPGGPIRPSPTQRVAYENVFYDGLQQVLYFAEQEKIKILIEPEPNLLLENSDEFLNFIGKFNSNYVRLNFDIGHFFCVGEDPSSIVYSLREYIEHVHLADIASNRIHNHLIPGEGAIDFKSVFLSLKEINYTGFVTIELYPYQENPVYAAKRAFDYIISVLGSL